MKTQIRLALMLLASASAPAFAQSSTPQCAMTNFDNGRNMFVVVNPVQGSLNQQCFLTVMPKPGSTAAFPTLSEYPAPRIQEGNYEIELGGGGGGGGGASLFNSGGGGAGAVPVKLTRYLAPGVYRLTIGTGGVGGIAMPHDGNAERGGDGNPTSIANAYSGETIAGWPGAEVWAGRPRTGYYVASGRGNVRSGLEANEDFRGNGGGAKGIGAQSDGGSGALRDEKGRLVQPAQDGGMLKVAGYTAPPGRAGVNGGGGGGGASYGKGGDGVSADGQVVQIADAAAGGGGGGSNARGVATAGTKGGDGFIALRALDPIAQAPAPAAAQATPMETTVAPAVRARRDRN